MVAKCTEQELETLINYVKTSQIIKLTIEENGNELTMNYYRLEDLEPNKREEAKKVLDNSVKTSLSLIDKLLQLKKYISHNIPPISYSLNYDCTTGNNVPSYSVSSMLPNRAFVDTKETVEVDWDELFKDKLDEKVPNLFTKKSAKKYIPVTYGNLVRILKENNV